MRCWDWEDGYGDRIIDRLGTGWWVRDAVVERYLGVVCWWDICEESDSLEGYDRDSSREVCVDGGSMEMYLEFHPLVC